MGGSMTVPLMRITALGVVVSFDFTTIDLIKFPIFVVLYFTVILDFSFGIIGCFGHSGTTQPQELKADIMLRGKSPLFENSKICVPSSPCIIVSKL